jgi:hypothetical protein
MTHWKTLASSSTTLSAGDLGAHTPTATIAAVEGGAFESESGKVDKKALITLVGKHKQFAANVINCTLIEAMFGPDYEGWVGHAITLMADAVEVAGKYKGEPCVRVKGSPELANPLTVEIKLARRKPFTRQLVPTGRPL